MTKPGRAIAWKCSTTASARDPHRPLSNALNGFMAGLKARRAFARRWAETLQQAGEEAGTEEIERWGQRLINGLKAYDEDRYEAADEMFTGLLDNGNLETRWRAAALDWRGRLRYLTDRDDEALVDLNEAIQLAPDEAKYWADRGLTHRQMERYEAALADFTRAIICRISKLLIPQALFWPLISKLLRPASHSC